MVPKGTISIAWELLRKPFPWACFCPTESETRGWGLAFCILTSSPGNSEAHQNLRTTALGNIYPNLSLELITWEGQDIYANFHCLPHPHHGQRKGCIARSPCVYGCLSPIMYLSTLFLHLLSIQISSFEK